jgi:hypothetical protein
LWLNAASDSDAVSWEGVERSLVALGDHYVRGLAHAEDRAKAAQYVLDFLANAGFTKPWLLIFDNVDNSRVLDVWRPHGNVHTLVTSRISNWSLGVSLIEVDAWELPEAIRYLVWETGRADLSETELADLAKSLGRLPLALSHAGAYLRHLKGVTFKSVHKGSVAKKQVVLRFPSSTDVRWYRAPKFHAGQQGVFSLRPDQVSGHIAFGEAAASFSPEAAFTCLHSADFQPADNEVDADVAKTAAAEN